MNDFTRLSRPEESQVKIDPTPKECPADGFNYPSFRLVNKQGRVKLSPNPFNIQPATSYRLLAIANSRGWFAAVVDSALIFSPLDELRSTLKSAKEENDETFTPKRTVSTPGRATFIVLACNDTRLFVGLEQGQLLVYDTAALFSPGSENVTPLNAVNAQSGPIVQILPNPGTEAGLIEMVAVVRGDGSVQLVNMRLESQGGWVGSDAESVPVTVAWSPKGKHLAIGLRSGHILTFATTNKTTPHKHIPPTAASPLVSLNWLSPGHTFRTSYAPAIPNASDPSHHIISLDIKSSTATYSAPTHPFPTPDRLTQQAFTLLLPRWDEDSSSPDSKNLLVVGDKSSIDLEVLGSVGSQWYQQSQENPLSLPLDKSMDDTMLLSLEVDLTDFTTDSSTGARVPGAPVMYAYLNDGTLQGWYVEHSKPYLGMVATSSPAPASVPLQTSPFGSQAAGSSAFGQAASAAPQMSAFGQTSAPAQQSTPSAFGQPSAFGAQPSTSAFGQSSTFGTSSFGQQPVSAFGQTSTTSAFGQTTSPTAFGGTSQASAFGAPSPSPFGQQPQSGSAFGQPAQPTSAFGSKPVGSTAFGGGSSAFGGGSSGAFGAPATSAFGGGASGGFGAFSGASNTASAFGQTSFGFGTGTSSSSSTSAAPSTAAASPSAPDMSREASMSDSAPSIGNLSFGLGESNDGPSKSNKPGIFGSLSPPPSTPSTSSAFGGTIKPGAGFGAFSNLQTTSTSSNEPAKPGATSSSAFGTTSTPPSSAFGQSSFGQSSFGKPAFGQSAFGQSSFGKPAVPTATAPSTGGFGAFASAAPTAFGGAASAAAPPPTAPSTGGFGSFANSPSAFGPAKQGNTSAPSPSPFSTSTPEKSKSPFAAATTPASPFGGGSAFGGSSAFGGGGTPSGGGSGAFGSQSLFVPKLESTPKKPVAIPSSPSSSPDASPRPGLSIDSDNESPPRPSPFGKTSTSSGTGAFGNLTTTPSAFKPATGFGAFGSDTTPTASPFFKAAETKTPPPVSVFSKPATTTTPASPSPSGTPAFGSSSALGGAKSAFAPASSSPLPAKAPATGGFGAFSGASSGFGAFAGPKKSFGELLKTGDAETKDPVKPTSSPFGASASAGTDTGKDKPPVFAFAQGPAKPESGATGSQPTTPAKEQAKDKSTPPSVSTTPITAFPPKKESPPLGGKPMGREESSSTLSTEPSFGNLSQTSDTGSFVEVPKDGGSKSGSSDGSVSSDESDAEGDDQAPPEDDDHSDSDGQSFLSSGSDDLDSNYGSDRDHSPEPTTIPLPASRSPSATPQPEVPHIRVSPSPTPSDSPGPSSPSGLPTIKEESTTPPGTPAKEPSSYFGKTATPPQTTPSPSTSTPFGLGLGRPSTRPTRSSPLSNAPVSNEDQEEGGGAKSPSAPPQKPPVSPRPHFTVLPMPPDSPTKPESEKPKAPVPKPASRPLTPPLSAFGSPKPPAAAPPPPTVPPAAPAFSMFGNVPPPQSPSPFGTPFSNNNKTAPAPAAPSTPSIFGPSKLFGSTSPPITPPTPPRFSFGAPPAPPAPATPAGAGFGLGSFSLKGTPTSSPSPTPNIPTSLFGAPTPPSATPTPPLFPSKPPAPPEPTLEEGMQKECASLITGLDREFEDLRLLAQDANRRRAELGKSAGGSRRKADLGDVAKWGLADAVQFGQVLQQYQEDLETLKTLREKQTHALRSLQTNMLKAGTRREEISRFNKAKDDNEFAKMLKARTLGPEHLETQTQLRRNIRTMRDRIQKLEDHLKASKKKLAQMNAGKPGLRAPSLDTINRTYRNIDIALQQQADDVSQLTVRVSKLNLTAPMKAIASTRDPRLPDAVSRRPYNVTPHVAITTAAALNAERSAHKLKRALLSVRKEPLLNVKAAAAPAPPAAFNTPQKALPPGFGFGTPAGPLFPKAAEPATPNWTLPEDNFHPATPPSGRRGGGAPVKKHQSVPLKRTPGGAASPPAPPAFDWGPLPTFSQAPATSMVEAVKLTPPKFTNAGAQPAQPNSFFGFGKKL